MISRASPKIANEPGNQKATILKDADQTIQELNAFWQSLSDAVAAGDFSSSADHYHDDAVYVSAAELLSYPLEQALRGWEPGFAEVKKGEKVANVRFRFSQRIPGQGTALETGIFRYSSGEPGVVQETLLLHFEALLVKKRRWQILMEFQKEPATEDEWSRLA